MLLNSSKKIVLCGLASALSTAIILMYQILPMGMYVFPAISGFIVLIMAIECGYSCGLEVFVITSILSIMFSGDKSASILFFILLGYYPILKLKIESMKKSNRLIKSIIKLIVFNVAIISEYWISITLFGLPEESLIWFGVYVPHVLLVMGNITFLLYDRCITVLIIIYLHKIRNKIFSNLKM